MSLQKSCLFIGLILLAMTIMTANAEDWPMWRAHSNRTATTSEQLDDSALQLHWKMQLPEPEPAWDNQQEVYCYGGPGELILQKQSFDIAYQPVVASDRMYVGSMNSDWVAAVDLTTGAELWRFYTDGPVRFAPVAVDGKVYFGSDDGFLYCLDTEGNLLWKKRGGPTNRKVLGNDRMMSVWPVRGAPVIPLASDSFVDPGASPGRGGPKPVENTDTLYFAVGTYPYEGSFIYALSKDTGDTIWCNDSAYMYFTNNPHSGAEGYSGSGPEGYLCTAEDGKILVPNARNRPACFNRETGKLLFHEISRNNSSKGDGGYHVTSVGNRFYVNAQTGAAAFSLSNGHRSSEKAPALYDEDRLQIKVGETIFDAGRIFGYVYDGSDFYDSTPWDDSKFGVSGGAFHVDLPARPAGLLAANGHLIVTTVDGWIYCYGEGAPQNGIQTYEYNPSEPTTNPKAVEILAAANYKGGSRGICVLLGLEDGSLMEAIAAGSDMTVVAFETDAAKVQAVRERLDAVGLYGRKAHIITEDFLRADVPSYCAHIITSEKDLPANETLNAEIYRVLRPYGGTAVVNANLLSDLQTFASDQPKAEVTSADSFATLRKVGKLPGTADWTHQHCNVQQTTLSEDELVKLPLGVLWFGGSADNTNDAILPRHGHGPSPQVVGGRYYIEGRNVLRCVDAYTGRVLWEKMILNLGQFSDYTDHQAGQLALGDNYISTEDVVYVLGSHADNDWPTECLVLDAATGEELKTFSLPDGAGWGMIAVYEDYLIATGMPMLQDLSGYNNAGNMLDGGWIYQDSDPLVGVGGMGTYNGSTSVMLHVLNSSSGEVLWSAGSDYGFFHNSIVAGADKLFVMDRINWNPSKTLKSRMNWNNNSNRPGKSSGNPPDAGEDSSLKEAKLTAYDIATGQKVWEHTHEDAQLFGSWLTYSEEYNVLVECQRNSRDYWEDEQQSKHMAVWQGADGNLLWNALNRRYLGGPVILNGDMIITQSGNDMGAVNLLTGEPYLIVSGVTGEPGDFAGFKRYGCGTGIACKNLMIFRSGNAGYYDLNTFSGTGNWGGFKSGCTINLIPANGLLVAPEYTRTCACSYQFQTSCALIHRDDVEQWSCNKNLGEQFAAQGGRLQNVGFNFGAIGDRVDDDGILWMEYPFGEPAAGYSYQIPVDIKVNGSADYFRHHSLTVTGSGLNWVAASGMEGASSVTIDMVGDASGREIVSPAQAYDVYLYFAESNENAQAGERVFSVSVNDVDAGQIDVAGTVGPRNILVRKLQNVTIDGTAEITLTASVGQTLLCGVGFDSLAD